jgi:hypothetical protein
MAKITPYQASVLSHINHLTGEIHDSTNQIYEHLVDREYLEVKLEVKSLIKTLEGIIDSLEDEV